MKFCKVCNRQAENESFEFCPHCGYELIDRVVTMFELPKNMISEYWLRNNTDLNEGQINNLTHSMKQKMIEIKFDGDDASSIKIVGI